MPALIFAASPEADWNEERKAFSEARGERNDVIAELYYTRNKDLFHPVWGKRFNRIRTALFDWPHKLIVSSDGHTELYDLATDPRELKNLLALKPDLTRDMSQRLEDLFARRTRAGKRVEQPPLSEEELKRLKSLGYIGGGKD